MNEIKLYIPMKPVSVNNLRQVVRGRLINTRETNSFKKHCKLYLLEYGHQLKHFAKNANNKIEIHGELIFLTPHDKLFTKKNEISKTSGDVDNNSKCVIDEIFNALSFHNKNLNDAQITKLTLSKSVAENGQHGFIAKFWYVKNGILLDVV